MWEANTSEIEFFFKKTQGNFIEENFNEFKKWVIDETDKILFFDVWIILVYKSVPIVENDFQCSSWRKQSSNIILQKVKL